MFKFSCFTDCDLFAGKSSSCDWSKTKAQKHNFPLRFVAALFLQGHKIILFSFYGKPRVIESPLNVGANDGDLITVFI